MPTVVHVLQRRKPFVLETYNLKRNDYVMTKYRCPIPISWIKIPRIFTFVKVSLMFPHLRVIITSPSSVDIVQTIMFCVKVVLKFDFEKVGFLLRSLKNRRIRWILLQRLGCHFSRNITYWIFQKCFVVHIPNLTKFKNKRSNNKPVIKHAAVTNNIWQQILRQWCSSTLFRKMYSN